MSIVLDTGALIALERNDRPLWMALKVAALRDEDVLVPSAALAQVWRGTPRQARLASALEFCVVASFDALARAVGELCRRAKTRDVVDAQVAIVASTSEVLYTSDPEDMARLLRVYRRGAPAIVRC